VGPPPVFDATSLVPTDPAALGEVGPEGVITSWCWNPLPRAGQPFDRPFAWALVQLDGADTSILHALDAQQDQISTGQRVRIRWAAEPRGFIDDIACFEVAE
jgi:uncharacterized OB-fold protein